MKHTTGLFLALLLLSSCSTPYQSDGFRGGFSELDLAPDMVRIQFSGNAYTSAQRVQDFALLRASQTMLARGFPYFAVVNNRHSSKPVTFTTPATATTTTTGSGYTYGSVDRQGHYSGTGNFAGQSTTTYNPGETVTLYKPETGLIVVGFREKPSDVAVFDAAFLQNSLRAHYKIKSPPVVLARSSESQTRRSGPVSLEEVEQFLAWAEANKNGCTLTNAGGEVVSYTAEQIAARKADFVKYREGILALRHPSYPTNSAAAK
jgi:hypothetical protein